MSHRADVEFFDRKKAWSVRKDRILGSYLAAYLPKINTQRRPILLIDGFAGAGKFQDGTAGSPLIIHAALKKAAPSSGGKLLAIEREDELHGRLSHLFAGNRDVEVRNAAFLDCVDDIRRRASDYSLFLFLDPYAVRGLELARLNPIFDLLCQHRSVEVLINFNAPIFVRWALAALARPRPEDFIEDDVPPTPELSELDRIVGGDWWRDVVVRQVTFARQVDDVVEGYCDQLRSLFQEVCFHKIYHRSRHTVPKYVLVFASRHPDALELMNDEMVKSARSLIEEEAAGQIDLFDSPLTGATADVARLTSAIITLSQEPIERGRLIQSVMRQEFGQYLRKEIRGMIEASLKSCRMASATGKTRINDEVRVWWIKGA